MTKKEKLIERMCRLPKDFTFAELETVLLQLGFEKDEKGKTSGSRVQRQANAVFGTQAASLEYH